MLGQECTEPHACGARTSGRRTFLRGIRHIQLEPVWGGRSDTAGTLRGTCALALVQCRSLSERELLNHLIELFADEDKSVRVEAARAVEQVGSPSAAALLRLRAVLGAAQKSNEKNDEPEVLGACFGGILRIEGKGSITWISRFLTAGDDIAAEAAFALAADRSPEAFNALHKRFMEGPSPDAWFLSSSALGHRIDPTAGGARFSAQAGPRGVLHAEPAIEAILRSGPSNEVIHALEEAVAGNQRLARVVAANKPVSS